MNIGIIGTGKMGSVVLEGLIGSGSVTEDQLSIINRTVEKAIFLKKKYPGLYIAESVVEIAETCDLVFICIKPGDIPQVLDRIKDHLSEEKCLVSITSPISTGQLESVVTCSCIRVIPSITNRALAGATLITFGNRCSERWKNKMNDLMKQISNPVEISEAHLRISSDIASCGPAFLTFLLQKFIDAAVEVGKVEKEYAVKLAEEMITGMGELIKKGHYTLPDLHEKVCVQGGVIGAGIKVLEASGTEKIFAEVFRATESKFREDVNELKGYFPAAKI